MIIFKLIEIDMGAERARINKPGTYNKRQRAALLKLCDLFEAGEWQQCLNHVRDEKAFPYNEKGEYPEVEHIGIAMQDILQALGYYNFYTSEQLLKDAEEELAKRKSK